MQNTIFTLFLFVLVTTGYSQSELTYLNYHSESKSRKLSWELVVKNDKPKDSLMDLYMDEVVNKIIIHDYKKIDDMIIGRMEEVHTEGYGHPINFNYKVAFKDGRYKIVITEIVFLTSKTSFDGFTLGDTTAETWFLNGKGTKFKIGYTNTKIMRSLEKYFKEKFILKETQLNEDDDW